MAKVNIKSEKITPFGGIYYARLFMRFHLTKSSTALFRWQVHLPLHHNQWLGQWREECYRNIQQAWGERARLRPSQQWFRMEASAMPFLNENTVYMILTAFCMNFFSYFIRAVSSVFTSLSPTSRVKKFVFHFTTVCAKWTRTARRWWLNLYTGMPYDKLSFG